MRSVQESSVINACRCSRWNPNTRRGLFAKCEKIIAFVQDDRVRDCGRGKNEKDLSGKSERWLW
jgi:hypothetical protein